ncbi:MAG: thioesterase II family protein [Anaerococcus sp.]
MDILCLPYAGGSKSIFFNIKKHTDFNLIDYELPGRGRRIREDDFDTIEKIVEDILEKVTFNKEYLIWGHSMGGYIAYELIKQIESKKIRRPKKVIISGQVPPSYKNKNMLDKIINLDNDDFMKFLINYGGTNPKVFENKDLAELFLNIIRNDYNLVSKYTGYPLKKINTRIDILYGDKDESVSEEKVYLWKDICYKIKFKKFQGGHFFINDLLKNSNEINSILTK